MSELNDPERRTERRTGSCQAPHPSSSGKAKSLILQLRAKAEEFRIKSTQLTPPVMRYGDYNPG